MLHTHSQAGTLLSQWALEQASTDGVVERACLEVRDLEMLKGLEGITSHACTIEIPVLANSQDLEALSAAAEPFLAGAPQGILIGGHGLYAWGRNLGSAVRHLEILEFLLEQRWRRLLLDAITVGTGHSKQQWQ